LHAGIVTVLHALPARRDAEKPFPEAAGGRERPGSVSGSCTGAGSGGAAAVIFLVAPNEMEFSGSVRAERSEGRTESAATTG
jgi:hypothetical protein